MCDLHAVRVTFGEVQYLDDDTSTVHDGETGTPLRVKRSFKEERADRLSSRKRASAFLSSKLKKPGLMP